MLGTIFGKVYGFVLEKLYIKLMGRIERGQSERTSKFQGRYIYFGPRSYIRTLIEYGVFVG